MRKMLRSRAFWLFMTYWLVGLAYAQDRVVSGTIIDNDSKEPLPGVNVLVKGTTVGTVTDLNGQYRLNVPANGTTLVFSSIGYMAQEMEIGNSTTVDLALTVDVKSLSEVVVIGYGTQEKKDITGAITSVGAKEIMEVPVMNAAQALQGRAAGVDVVTLGTRPGQGAQVRIRGRRSFVAGNDPLIVLDGIPFTGDINDINPADIQSMEILKDASATAIYGSRGSNGVVLITTKRGGDGKTYITYDGYYGPSMAYGKVDIMNGEEFAEMKRESRRTTGQYPNPGIDPVLDENLFEAVEFANIQNGNSWTDYQDLILQTGHQQNHQLGMTGGNDKTAFNFSLNYFGEKGITRTQDFKRFTTRVNLDHKISKRFKIGTSTMLTYSTQNWGPDVWGGALAENPLGKPYEDDGTLRFRPTSDGLRTNPLADLVDGAYVDERRNYRIFSSMYANVEIAKGLTYQLNFGPDIRYRRRGLFQGRYTNARAEGAPLARTENDLDFSYTLENIINYNKKLGDIHSISGTALFSVQEYRGEGYSAEVQNQPYESSLFYNIGSAPLVNSVGSDLAEWAILSWMGRVQYGLKDKYLITATVRADGSSRLAEGNKWGLFPSVALGWRIKEESFLKSSTFVDDLKLRASYGVVGNTEGLRPYITQGGLARTIYAFGNSPAFGYRPDLISNPDLRWEGTSTLNIGLDFAFFNGRISGSAEYYVAVTDDLIMNRFLPTTSGFSSVQENIGKVQNKGIELTMSTVNVDATNGFRWSTDLSFNRNVESIQELYGGKEDDIGNRWFIGQPMTVYYDLEKIGIWQLGEEQLATSYGQKPGQIKVKDQPTESSATGDGRINGDDRVILGTDQPDFILGLTNRFEYKGLDLSIFAFSRWGQMVRSRFHDSNSSLFGRYNNLDVDYWTPTNPTNSDPRPNQDQEFPLHGSTRSYKDGSFIKIRTISLGYTLPTSFAEKLRMANLRVYATAQQPLIWARDASLKNLDPERTLTPAGGGAERSAELEADVPSLRMFLFGISAKF